MKKRFEKNQIPQGNIQARHEIAEQIHTARKEMNMTQQQLADLTGTQKSNISRMESGRYNPSLDFMVKLADGLGKKITIALQ